MPSTRKQPFNLTLDPGVVSEVDKLAKKENRSRSFIINEFSKEGLARMKVKHK